MTHEPNNLIRGAGRSKLSQGRSFARVPGTHLWLTFYLSGQPVDLWRLSEALESNGWVNVGGWETAFLYPKIQVEKSSSAIVQAAEAARELCARHGVEIINIDADTSPDVRRSRFVTLYRP